MDGFGRFIRHLSDYEGSQLDKAVLILSASKQLKNETSLSVAAICDYFEAAHLARPNPTVLSRRLTADRRVSSRKNVLRALSAADIFLEITFPNLLLQDNEKPGSLREDVIIKLSASPLIDSSFVIDLEKMLELYAYLHTLENSMRRLIEAILSNKFGKDWWDSAASAAQKRKNEDRLAKESSRRWLPARASLGPLYPLDWSDLVSIIRKFEVDFKPYIGEVEFMHRFVDMGLIRHVVAHHGFVDDENDYIRVKVALHDWQKQLSGKGF